MANSDCCFCLFIFICTCRSCSKNKYLSILHHYIYWRIYFSGKDINLPIKFPLISNNSNDLLSPKAFSKLNMSDLRRQSGIINDCNKHSSSCITWTTASIIRDMCFFMLRPMFRCFIDLFLLIAITTLLKSESISNKTSLTKCIITKNEFYYLLLSETSRLEIHLTPCTQDSNTCAPWLPKPLLLISNDISLVNSLHAKPNSKFLKFLLKFC